MPSAAKVESYSIWEGPQFPPPQSETSETQVHNATSQKRASSTLRLGGNQISYSTNFQDSTNNSVTLQNCTEPPNLESISFTNYCALQTYLSQNLQIKKKYFKNNFKVRESQAALDELVSVYYSAMLGTASPIVNPPCHRLSVKQQKVHPVFT